MFCEKLCYISPTEEGERDGTKKKNVLISVID